MERGQARRDGAAGVSGAVGTRYQVVSSTRPLPEAELRARYATSRALHERASRVIPGGGHLSGRPLVDTFTTPLYFERARGCRIWDVDGHEYIDYLMAFGAYLVGYAHPEIDRAAHEQGARGGLVSLNHPLHVEFIDGLLPLFPGAEMGVFFKTGSDATTAALRIGRRTTGRRRVVRCGYHGWHDWCLPMEDFVPAGLDHQVLELNPPDASSLTALFEAFPGEIGVVILAPEMVLPHDPAVFHALLDTTHAHGALFVMDEVKTGLRIAPNSIAQRVGLIPDMLTVSKALGNGWPVAALLGTREVMQAGTGMHYSATFHGDTAAMAAARATADWIRDHDVQGHVERLGEMLIEGLNALAEEVALPAIAYGEPLPAMPFFRFVHPDPETNAALTRVFFQQALAGGVLLHPRHMWFLSHAHSASDVERTLAVAETALRQPAAAVRP
jgi:glutamate-1-semialdehyde 2,1-aminomutase